MPEDTPSKVRKISNWLTPTVLLAIIVALAGLSVGVFYARADGVRLEEKVASVEREVDAHGRDMTAASTERKQAVEERGKMRESFVEIKSDVKSILRELRKQGRNGRSRDDD